jgi:hypothetical protein
MTAYQEMASTASATKTVRTLKMMKFAGAIDALALVPCCQ